MTGFKKIALSAAAAAMLGFVAVPTQAGPVLQGPVLNGIVLQGLVLQGLVLNGMRMNGAQVNGVETAQPVAVTLPSGETILLK